MFGKKAKPVLTKIQAETIFYNYIKWHDRNYKNIVEIKYAEFKDHYRFCVVYSNVSIMSVYGVFKHSGYVMLAPTGMCA